MGAELTPEVLFRIKGAKWSQESVGRVYLWYFDSRRIELHVHRANRITRNRDRAQEAAVDGFTDALVRSRSFKPWRPVMVLEHHQILRADRIGDRFVRKQCAASRTILGDRSYEPPKDPAKQGPSIADLLNAAIRRAYLADLAAQPVQLAFGHLEPVDEEDKAFSHDYLNRWILEQAFDGDIGTKCPFDTWMREITKNAAIRATKSRETPVDPKDMEVLQEADSGTMDWDAIVSRFSELPPAERLLCLLAEVLPSELRAAAWEHAVADAGLTPRLQDVGRLHLVEARPRAEIAAAMGESENYVYNAWFHCRNKLRSFLWRKIPAAVRERLSRSYLEVIDLCLVQGMTYAEAADEISRRRSCVCTKNEVRTTHDRAWQVIPRLTLAEATI